MSNWKFFIVQHHAEDINQRVREWLLLAKVTGNKQPEVQGINLTLFPFCSLEHRNSFNSNLCYSTAEQRVTTNSSVTIGRKCMR